MTTAWKPKCALLLVLTLLAFLLFVGQAQASEAQSPTGLSVKTVSDEEGSIDVEWSAPACIAEEPLREYTYSLKVLDTNGVVESRDDFPAQSCTSQTAGGSSSSSLTTARVSNLNVGKRYNVTVRSQSEGQDPSDEKLVLVDLLEAVSTCHVASSSDTSATSVCECPPGQSHKNGSCTACPEDTYSPDGQACLACPTGASSSSGSTSIDECSCPRHSAQMGGACKCLKGYGGDATVTTKGCSACMIVGYKAFDGNEPCMICPKGSTVPFHISAAQSMSQCICGDGSSLNEEGSDCVCSLGYFGAAGVGGSGCHPCPFGTYKSFKGDSESCTECVNVLGEGASTDEIGSTSPGNCTCKFGRVRAGDTCIECPSGADCSQRELRSVAALPGYWRKSLQSTEWHECEQPLGHHVCVGQGNGTGAEGDTATVQLGSNCRKGHTGVLCAACRDDYGKNLGICTKCSTAVYFPTIVCVMALLLLVLVLYLLTAESLRRIHFIMFPKSKSPEDLEYETISNLKIFINWVQMVSLSYLKVAKNHSYEILFQVSSIGHLSPWMFQTFNCLFDFPFYDRFYYAMLVPVLCIVFAAILALALKASDLLNRAVFADVFVMKVHTLLFLTYAGCTRTVFEIFGCRTLDDNDSVLYADSSVSCNSSEYKQARLYGILFVCIYSVGLPLYILAFVCCFRNKLMERKMFIRFGLFFYNCKKETIWYEVFCMIRKLLIILVVSLIQEDTRRQIFLLSLLSVLYLGFHSIMKPYKSDALNALESQTLFSLAFTQNVCVLFMDGSSNENSKDFEMTFTWLVILFNVYLVLWCLSSVVKSYSSMGELEKVEKEKKESKDKLPDAAYLMDQARAKAMDHLPSETKKHDKMTTYLGGFKSDIHVDTTFAAATRADESSRNKMSSYLGGFKSNKYKDLVSNPLCEDL